MVQSGFWLLLGDVTNLQLSDPWTIMLAWVFIIMTLVPFLAQMDTEIRHEKKGQSWTEYGKKPGTGPPTNYEAYRAELQRRLRR